MPIKITACLEHMCPRVFIPMPGAVLKLQKGWWPTNNVNTTVRGNEVILRTQANHSDPNPNWTNVTAAGSLSDHLHGFRRTLASLVRGCPSIYSLASFPAANGPRAESCRRYLERRDGEEKKPSLWGYSLLRGRLSGLEWRSADGRGVNLETPSPNNNLRNTTLQK